MSAQHGHRLVHAATSGKFDEIEKMLANDIEFRGATPGMVWHTQERPETMKMIQQLFPADERVMAVTAFVYRAIPGRHHICYRARGEKDGFGPFEYEQQLYYRTVGERINRLQLLCSGLYPPER